MSCLLSILQQASFVGHSSGECDKIALLSWFVIQKSRLLVFQCEEKQKEIEKMTAKKRNLEKDIRLQKDRVNEQRKMESRIRRDILLNADIVCCTLSGSGSQTLQNDLSMRDSDG